MAGEVSKDLTRRLLLPEEIVKADQEGLIHFQSVELLVGEVEVLVHEVQHRCHVAGVVDRSAALELHSAFEQALGSDAVDSDHH